MSTTKKIVLAVVAVVIIGLLIYVATTGSSMGTVECQDCGGSGVVDGADCETCGGEGSVRAPRRSTLPSLSVSSWAV